jgi:hypothetical protein
MGYLRHRIGKTVFRAHRVAFLLMTGRWAKIIDHVNRDSTDNRWCNLREVTNRQNAMNAKRRVDNTSGSNGVFRMKNGKYGISILSFETLEAATFARQQGELIWWEEQKALYGVDFDPSMILNC